MLLHKLGDIEVRSLKKLDLADHAVLNGEDSLAGLLHLLGDAVIDARE